MRLWRRRYHPEDALFPYVPGPLHWIAPVDAPHRAHQIAQGRATIHAQLVDCPDCLARIRLVNG